MACFTRFKQLLFCNKRQVCFHVPGPPNLILFLHVLQFPQSTRRQTLQFPQFLDICGLPETEELGVFVTDRTWLVAGDEAAGMLKKN